MPAKRDALERFWEKVETSATRSHEGTPCLEWRAAHIPEGHGRFWFEGRMIAPYRFIWQKLRGKIPKGLVLDHLCQNPPCVNVLHLEPVTIAVNTARGKTGWAGGTCHRGHDITDPNVGRTHKSNGERFCHDCKLELQRERRAKAKI